MRVFARLSAVMLFLLAGCGGGGGGGGGGGVTALTYSGNTNQAAVMGTNASKLTADVLGSGEAAALLGGASIQGDGSTSDARGGASDVARRLGKTSRETLVRVKRVTAAPGVKAGAIPVNETVPCDSGFFQVSGELSDSGTGALTVTYNNCRLGDDTANGQGEFRVDVFLIDLTISFVRVSITGPGLNSDATGSVRVEAIAADTERLTSNLVTLNNLTGGLTRTDDLVLVNLYDDVTNPSSIISGTITGRIYDSVHGFVDIITLVPFAFANINQSFPNTGEIRLAGSGNPLHARALSSTRVELRFDTNADNAGDGFAALMSWTDLAGPVGADIGDADGDGMHNSWETVNNAFNAGADLDGDGFDNFTEYQNGTNPNVFNP
jgi:hypothetical protein